MNDSQVDYLAHEILVVGHMVVAILFIISSMVLFAMKSYLFSAASAFTYLLVLSAFKATVSDGYNRSMWQRTGSMNGTPLNEKRDALEVDWK